MKSKKFSKIIIIAVVVLSAMAFVVPQIVKANSLTAEIVNDQVVELSEEEKEDLYYMREEEKLARDVYLTLYEQWDLSVFKRIASSEQKHMDSVGRLLEAYEIPDIIVDDRVGIFVNTELQKLYSELIEKGSKSIADALLVGGMIEEVDILDLEEAIKNTTHDDIARVYERLLRGSYNHLRAFISNYKSQTGETYKYQLMEDKPDEVEKDFNNFLRQGRGNRR